MASSTEGEILSLTDPNVANLHSTVRPTIKLLFRQGFPLTWLFGLRGLILGNIEVANETFFVIGRAYAMSPTPQCCPSDLDFCSDWVPGSLPVRCCSASSQTYYSPRLCICVLLPSIVCCKWVGDWMLKTTKCATFGLIFLCWRGL